MIQIRLLDAPPKVDFVYKNWLGETLTVTQTKFSNWDYVSWWHESDVWALKRFDIRYEVVLEDRRKHERRK